MHSIKRSWVPLFGGLLFCAILRWLFGGENMREPDLSISYYAMNLSASIRDYLTGTIGFSDVLSLLSITRAEIGIRGLSLAFPWIASFILLDVNSFSFYLPTLIASVASAYFLFEIARKKGGQLRGFYAVLLYGIAPGLVFIGKSYLWESVYALVVLIFVWCLFYFNDSRNPNLLVVLVTLGLFGWMLSATAPLYFISLLIIFYGFLNSKRSKFVPVFLIGSIFMTLFLFEGVNHLYEFMARPENILWILLFIVAIVLHNKTLNGTHHKFMLTWLALSLAPIFNVDICSSTQLTCADFTSGNLASYMIFIPFAYLISELFVVKSKHPLFEKQSLLAVMLVAIIAVALVAQSPRLISQGISPFSSGGNSLVLLSAFVFPLAFLLIIALPLQVVRFPNWNVSYRLVLISIFGIASLAFFFQKAWPSQALVRAIYDLMPRIAQENSNDPITSNLGSVLIANIVYPGDFKIDALPDDITKIVTGFVIVDEKALQIPVPPSWFLLQREYGANGMAYSLYRIKENGDVCNDYFKWVENWVNGKNSQARLLEIGKSVSCFSTSNTPLLSSIVDSSLANRFFTGVDAIAIESRQLEVPERFWRVTKGIPFYQDWRLYDIQIQLEPDRIYLLSVVVRSQFPSVTLYLSNGDDEWYLPQRTYPEWIQLNALFSTYGMEAEDLSLLFSPVIFGDYQFILMSDFTIIEIDPELGAKNLSDFQVLG